jgi:DNA-directed RNA polymerase subunit M/transcription elongation factor TFIIS
MGNEKVVETAVKAMKKEMVSLENDSKTIIVEIGKLETKLNDIQTEIIYLQQGINYLEKKAPETKVPKCKKCGSDKLHKDGLRKYPKGVPPKQKWMCLTCGHKFVLPLESFEIPTEPDKYPEGVKKSQTTRKDYTKTGRTFELMAKIKARLDAGESLLIVTAEKDYSESNGILWQAMNHIITDKPEAYEWFKDVTKKYCPKGMRLKDPTKRKSSGAVGIFCPKCKSLLIPGENCKKCAKGENK